MLSFQYTLAHSSKLSPPQPLPTAMAIFRQYIAPFLIVLVFLFALLAVGARSFLPNDMAAPAPVEEVGANSLEPMQAASDTVAGLPPTLQVLVKGLPEDPALSAQLGVSVN